MIWVYIIANKVCLAINPVSISVESSVHTIILGHRPSNLQPSHDRAKDFGRTEFFGIILVLTLSTYIAVALALALPVLSFFQAAESFAGDCKYGNLSETFRSEYLRCSMVNCDDALGETRRVAIRAPFQKILSLACSYLPVKAMFEITSKMAQTAIRVSTCRAGAVTRNWMEMLEKPGTLVLWKLPICP